MNTHIGNKKIIFIELEDFSHRSRDPGVQRYAPHKNRLTRYIFSLSDIALEISRYRLGQPFQDLIRFIPLLLSVYHIGFSENAAPSGYFRRTFRLHYDIAYFVDVELQPVCLLVHEGSRTRRAISVCFIILYPGNTV